MSRRRFLQASAGLTLLVACGSNDDESSTGATGVSSTLQEPTRKLSGNLRILQWSHFVPRHDRWFDGFVADWGRQVGVNVSVDHINLADIQARAAAEISAREGHDLIEFLSPPSAFEQSLLDLSDVNEEAKRRFGDQIGFCTRSSFNPKTKKYYGFCHGWVPDPSTRTWQPGP
jgi:multiple sugar transport system substrate-binding protein